MNQELPDVKAGLRKDRQNRDQLTNISCITETREFQKKKKKSVNWLHKCLWLCGSQQTVENSQWDGHTRLPYLPTEKPVCSSIATVRNERGTMDWFKIGKGVCQGYILSPCLFSFYAEYIMQNTRLNESQAGSKNAGRNTNNLIFANDTILM